MLVFETILTAGYLAGTILYTVLLLVMMEGRRERGTPGAYPWLVAAALLWHFGNLLAIFFGQLTTAEIPPQLEKIARLIATVGLGLLPSTLIHSAVAAKLERFSRPKLAVILGYVPSATILPAVYFQIVMPREEFFATVNESPVLLGLLGGWFVVALVFVGHTMYAPGKFPSDSLTARFNRAFGVGLFFLAGLTALMAGLELGTGGRTEIIGEFLVMFVMLIALLPGALLVYYVYRYRYMDLTIRRSLSFVAVVVAVVLTYSLVIKNIMHRLEDRFSFNFSLLEGALVAGAVVLFEPARRRLQAAIDAAFAPERGRRSALIAGVQGQVASAPPGDLRPVVARTQLRLSDIFHAPAVVVLRAPEDAEEDEVIEGVEGGDTLASAPANAARYAGPILGWAARAEDGPSRRDELPRDAAGAAEKLGIIDVVPIRTDGSAGRGPPGAGPPHLAGAAGFLGLGTRPKRTRLGQQDADALTALANTLAASVRDAHVVRRLVMLEHKLAEAEKLSSLGRLSATIAHEVKNPLSSIKTIVGVLRESMSDTDAASQDLAVIASEVDRLSTVVTSLLDVARPAKKPGEGTAVVPPPEGFDTREMIEGLLAVLGPDAKRRGIELETDFAPGTPNAAARESAVRQAVFQIVLNAIEVTPKGGMVTLRTGSTVFVPEEESENPGPGVEIVVEDTGPGVPDDKLDRVFEPFFSLKPAGTGLGLAIAKEEIARTAGAIQVAKRPDGGRGAHFRVILPAAKRLAPT